MNLYSHLVGAAVAKKDDLQIQVGARYLFIKISGAAATVTEAEMKTALVSWSKAGKGGQDPMQNKISLYNLAEINAAKEGLFFMSGTNFECMIELGDGGALQLGASEYISLNFEGFQTDWNVDIYVINDAVVTKKYLSYVADNISSKTQQDLDLRGSRALFFPVAAISKLYLNYNIIDANGQSTVKSVQYLAEELRGLMFLSNELVQVNSLTAPTTIIVVSEEFYGLDVKDAVSGYVEYVAGSTSSIFYIKSEAF